MAKPTSSKKKGSSVAMSKYDARLAEIAAMSKKAVQGIGTGSGNFISCKGGIMTFQKNAIPGNAIRCVVVDWVLENQYYKDKYDEDNPASPDCFAFGIVKEDMSPNPDDVTQVQSDSCADCPHLEWGSAETGKGKACSEVARLALISEADFENLENAEIASIKVNVTSMKFWGGYLRQLQDVYDKPSCAFVTNIKIVPYTKQPGWRLDFELSEAIDDDATMGSILVQFEKVHKTISAPYPKNELEKKAKPKGPPKKLGKAIPSPAATTPGKKMPSAKGTPVKGVKAPSFS